MKVSANRLTMNGGSPRLTRLSSTSKTWNFAGLLLLWPPSPASWLDELGNASALGLIILSGVCDPVFAR